MQEFRNEFHDTTFGDDSDTAECVIRAYKASGIPFVVIFDEYDVTSCIALAYITVILPIIREKAQSKLNNFREITFLEPFRYAPFTGFTSDEVRFLCGKYGMDFEECKSWYDWYAVEGIDIYAPNSMVSAMQNGRFRGYWGQTSTYRAVKDLIGLDMVGMKDDVFTYICHLGYLLHMILKRGHAAFRITRSGRNG